MEEKYAGKTLLCRARPNSEVVSGRISFSPDFIGVKLVGSKEFSQLKRDDVLPLLLEDNQFCTISPISISQGQISTATLGSYFIDIDVIQAVIGFRPWERDELVEKLHFRISDANGLFVAPDIEKSIAFADMNNLPESKILEIESDGTKVKISFCYSFSWSGENFQVTGVAGEIIFSEGKKICELNSTIGALRTFFTMAAGVEVFLSDYWLEPLERCEQSLIGGGSVPARFQLIWPGTVSRPRTDYGNLKPRCILRSWGADDRRTTSNCLQFWMDNWEEWQRAFTGIFMATREGTTFDPNRILNACKWLESTPGAAQQKISQTDDLNAIAEAAIAKANEIGLNIETRISGAIGRLGTESRNSLFERLVDLTISTRYPALKNKFLTDLHKAYYLRGGFSHTKFEHAGDEEFDDFVRSTMAVEALAFLLLYRNLPLPEHHPWPSGSHTFTEYFHMIQ